MKKFEIIIIGGGAAGLFAGANLDSKNVLIVEKNSTLGLKLNATGGGRCNITNTLITPKHYIGDEQFLREVLSKFNPKALLRWFEERGIKFSLEKDRQYFCKDRAKSITNILKTANSKNKILLNTEVLDVQKNGESFEIQTSCGKFISKVLIVASGGVSYKKLGATDIAIKIAQNFNLRTIPLKPALVGLCVQKNEFWFKNLSGVCFPAILRVAEREIVGDILFTHKGLSGPAAMNASLFWDKGMIEINFLPKFNFKNMGITNKFISSVLPLPKSFIKEFLKAQNLDDSPLINYNTEEFEKLTKLQSYHFAPAGTFGFERAEITKGGVCTSEISPINFETNSVPNLYFIGEALDINGMLGGYNLHFAFASAWICVKGLSAKFAPDFELK